VNSIDCESFARRTFTTPKIRTFTTPKFGHFPPPKKNICQEDNCHPQFFSSFFGALFLAFSTYSSWRTSRMGRRRCLMRWSWSTSSRRCVTRWSWSTSSRRWLSWWSWRMSRRRKGRLSFMFLFTMRFPAGISIDLLVWLSCRVSYINNNTISG